MSPADLAQRLAALDWSATSLQHQLAVTAAVETLKGQTNVIPLPVRPRTCWTTLCQLDGRRWASSSHFGPGGAWAWIVETVAAEHGVRDDQIDCMECNGEYGGDDLVTVDGMPIYRIRHVANIT